MLSIYRRHRPKCKFADDRISKKCRCPLWATGTVEGKPYRKSLKTRSFERAQQIVKQIEDGAEPEQLKGITVKEAVQACIADCEARRLNHSTLAKYRLLGRRLQAFALGQTIRDLHNFTVGDAVAFRGSWQGSPRTLSKTLERLRAFFNFFIQNGWLPNNPARGIKAPEIRPNPTLPFTDTDVSKILAQADEKARTFFKVLLHSGLRIIDAAQLRPERIEDGKLFLYQQKTGVPVRIPLPPDLVNDLNQLPPVGGFYFAVESDKPSSIAEYYRVRLSRVAKAVGVKNAHPHRFRDTFAVRLLEKGVPLETVSILLGHTDLKTTQRSYAPWVQSLQSNLEVAVQKTWQSRLLRVK